MSDPPASGASVGSLQDSASAAGIERLDGQLLLAAVLGRSRAWLAAHADFVLTAQDESRCRDLLARRAAGEPLAYLLGEKEFHGLALQVSPAVLVPRADTETLVDWALDLLPVDVPTAVLDLGTGSGAIALALAQKRPRARITAVDISGAALAVAQANAKRHGLDVRWLVSDWFTALSGERFGLIVGNPPYVAEGDAHLGALRHEPLQALTAGADGLDALRRIVGAAGAHLEPGGWLLLEHGHDQSEAVRALLSSAGLADLLTRPDLAGLPRCSGGRHPAPA